MRSVTAKKGSCRGYISLEKLCVVLNLLPQLSWSFQWKTEECKGGH